MKPRIELLYWDGCPSHPQALAALRSVLDDFGCAVEVGVRRIDTEEEAATEGFVGSPTIRVDGVDPLAPPADEPIGLTCRIYRLRDGRVSPTPDPELLHEALSRLLAPSTGRVRRHS